MITRASSVEDPIGDEARIIVDLDRRLPDGLGEFHHACRGRVTRGESADDLHELHDRHRVHEVHADDLVGPLGLRRDLGDRDGARVRRGPS